MGTCRDQYIAQRGGLGGSSEHREPDPVGGRLAQQPVLRTAADDVDGLDAYTGQRCEGVKGPA